jgi:hypothetical protein
MKKNNPFPGMNLFLERFWPDVYLAIIGYIRDEIAAHLPPGLKERGEENIRLAEPDDKSRILRPDVAGVESWRRGVPPSWQPRPCLKTLNSYTEASRLQKQTG